MTESNKFIGFDRLKQSVTLEQVLERYGLLERLHRSGDSLSGPCPIHQGHKPWLPSALMQPGQSPAQFKHDRPFEFAFDFVVHAATPARWIHKSLPNPSGAPATSWVGDPASERNAVTSMAGEDLRSGAPQRNWKTKISGTGTGDSKLR